MARNRDHAKEYQQRKAREAQRGYSSPRQGLKARREGKPTAKDELAKKPGRSRQVHRAPNGKTILTQTTRGKGAGVIQDRLDQLPRDHPVEIHVEVQLGQGGTATVIESRPAWWFQSGGGGFEGGVVAVVAGVYDHGGTWEFDDIEDGSLSFSYDE